MTSVLNVLYRISIRIYSVRHQQNASALTRITYRLPLRPSILLLQSFRIPLHVNHLLLYPFRPNYSLPNPQASSVQMNGSGYNSSIRIWATYSSKRVYAVWNAGSLWP
jgi:hypothetical protein